jgi:hypothetical protein
VNAAEQLAKAIIENYDNPLPGSTIDVPAHVDSLVQSLGATTSDSGGAVTYYGADTITPDRLPYGSISAIPLAAKAILIAKIWKERTGEGQDTHVDVRKSLRRLTPFLDGSGNSSMGSPDARIHTAPFPAVQILFPPGMASGLSLPRFTPPCASVQSISLNPGAARMRRYAMRSKSGTVTNLKQPLRKRPSPCRWSSIRILMDSLSIPQWVAIPASRK